MERERRERKEGAEEVTGKTSCYEALEQLHAIQCSTVPLHRCHEVYLLLPLLWHFFYCILLTTVYRPAAVLLK